MEQHRRRFRRHLRSLRHRTVAVLVLAVAVY